MKKFLFVLFILHAACYSSPIPGTEDVIDPPPPTPIDAYLIWLIVVMLLSACYLLNKPKTHRQKNETYTN
jgi:hypothetical protein